MDNDQSIAIICLSILLSFENRLNFEIYDNSRHMSCKFQIFHLNLWFLLVHCFEEILFFR